MANLIHDLIVQVEHHTAQVGQIPRIEHQKAMEAQGKAFKR